jgi:phytoene desaturase
VNPSSSSSRRAIVVGSGFGGLAAAIRLRARGYETTVLEMRDKPGGRAYVFEDRGFIYDAGPTIITAPFLIDELFTLAGRCTEDYVPIVPVTPYYRIVFHDGRVFDYTGDEAEIIAQIKRFNPDDVPGYLEFVGFPPLPIWCAWRPISSGCARTSRSTGWSRAI